MIDLKSVVGPDEFEILEELVNNGEDIFDGISADTYDKLYELFLNSGEMPIDVAKSKHSLITADVWIQDRIEDIILDGR